MQEQRTVKLERLRTHREDGHRTMSLFVRPNSRRGAWIWFEPDQVPEFEGDMGWFEIERRTGGWSIVRQVEKPAWAR